jgi:hypothetical protein
VNKKFGKLVDGKLVYAPDLVAHDGRSYINPKEPDYLKADDGPWYPVESLPRPPAQEGQLAVAKEWELIDGRLIRNWEFKPIVYTYDDYDNAMEDYIHQVAVDRGYTRREPSEYKGDPYPRFAQDAEDFIAFRSSVMLYALPILNEYEKTGNAPTLAEFKAGFPKMVWSYTEEAAQ